MISNVSDVINEVLVRNNRTTTDSFITDQMLEDWLREAHAYCSTYKKWPFTEVRDESVAWAGEEEIDYSAFNVNYRSDSIRILQIGGRRLQKLNYEDYLIFKEQSPSSDDRVFSDFGRVLFINTVADVSGTISAYGQYLPSIDPTDATATTVFSTYDEEGNEALVEKMTGYLKRREHLPDEAELHDARADQKMERVWDRIGGEQHAYQTHRDRGGMWSRIDIVDGWHEDEKFRRNQF
jgi:hypothetical protein